MRRAILAIIALMVSDPVQAESFSCSFGQPACLDYGDKVCSSSAKCVSESAACFDSYQCNYEGFTCKSNVTECYQKNDELVRDYNGLLEKHRALASEYDDLVQTYNALLTKHRDLGSQYDELLDVGRKIEVELSDLKDCVDSADDLDGAKACVF